MNEEKKKVIKMLDKFTTEHKFYNIKHSDNLEDNIEIVLNLIEKLQKENEELKQDRNNNYQMIALAQNEVLGYMQGYEDGKKLKRSAVAYVVENQQYYIIKKEIEHYKEYIEKLQKENEEKNKIINSMIKVMIENSICDYFIKEKCKNYAGENGKTCDECIKQYFENKVKDVK